MKKLIIFLCLTTHILIYGNSEAGFYDDNDFDGSDLVDFISAYGSLTNSPNYNAECDFGNDGDVDIVDLTKVAALFGRINMEMPDATGEVGAEGGTISSENGLSVIIPPGASDVDMIVDLSLGSNDELRFDDDNLELISILGTVHLDIGNNILSDNAELLIPKPENFNINDDIWLAKIIRLLDKDLFMNIDKAILEGETIITLDPAFNGVVSSGTFSFIQIDSPCGIPHYDNFFDRAGNSNPTCSEKLDLHSYFHSGYRELMANKAIYNSRIENTLTANTYIVEATDVAGHLASAVSLGVTPKNSLTFAADCISALETNIVDFTINLSVFEDETKEQIGALWFSLINCLFFEIWQPIPCADDLFFETLKSVSRLYTTMNLWKFNKRINEINIADEFLREYYIWSRQQDKGLLFMLFSPLTVPRSVILTR